MTFDLDKALIETYDRVNGDLVPVDVGPVPPVDERELACIEPNVNGLEQKIAIAKDVAKEMLVSRDPCGVFDTKHLPKILQECINIKVKETQAQPIMITAALLTSLSAMMGKKIMVNKLKYHQDLFPVVWMLTFAPSASLKTTSLNSGSSIAKRHETGVYERATTQEARVEDIRIKMSGKGKKSEADKEELVAAEKQLKVIESESVFLPARGSIEGLLDALGESKGGAVFSSEFGAWMKGLGKSYNEDLKATLTDLFDCPENPPKKRTKGEGERRLKYPFFSMCGVSTMEWVTDSIDEDDTKSGFLPRFLLFYPPQERIRGSARPLYREPDKTVENKIYDRAREIRDLNETRVYSFSYDGGKYFDGLYDEVYDGIEDLPKEDQDILFPFFFRWMAYIPKIGMLLQPFIDDCEKISLQALIGAYSVVRYAMQSTMFLYKDALGETPYQKKKRLLINYLTNQGGSVKRGKMLESKTLPGGVTQYNGYIETLRDAGRLSIEHAKKKSDEIYVLIK